MTDSSTIPGSANISSKRDAYMQYITDNFSDDLLRIYEVDGSMEGVQHLTNCIENGVRIWDYPLQVPLPE